MTTETKPRIAPNSKESEKMVLGWMLTSIKAVNVSADALDDSNFYQQGNQMETQKYGKKPPSFLEYQRTR
jgi:hypothetical protein